MKSWAVYVSLSLFFLLVLGILWGYRKDKRDELNLDKIRSDKNKIYVGVFLDPIIPV